ncbi:hypothetical protein ADUPG1_011277, partial [Aduncisulcus paluster]
YITYSDASTFTCTQPTDPDINCAGGCEYGQECKNVDDDASQGYCADIITDSVLRECLYEYLDPVDTVQDLHAFSVVSLKYLPLEIDCSSRAIVTLDGFEHAANVSTFNLSGCTSLTDIIALSPLIYLQELYLSGCSSISEWPFSSLNLPYAFETLDISDCKIDDEIIASTVPFLPELTSLFLRDNSSFSDMSCLYDLKDHLVNLDVANTGISSISALYANPQCSDTCSPLVESMSIASVISVVEDCVLCSEEALNENGVLSELDITSAPLDDYEELRHFPMLSKLSADSCNVTNFDLLHITPLDQLSYLSLNSNSISDPSPLYILSPSLMTLYLDENMICGTDASEGIKGKLEMGTCEVSCANQLCRCGTVFNSSNAVEDNKVCMETKTGSNSWYIVCAADSFFQYSSGAEFDCIETPSTSASSTTENVQTCVGGCEYGQECRVQDISTNSGVCLPVIVDDSLRQWIVDNFFDSDSIHIDSSVNPPLLSVASLKSVIDEEVIEFDYVEGESEGDSVTTLEGVEHLGFIIRSISLVGHGISSVSPLGSMTLLNKLDLSDNAVSDISWISQLCLLHILDLSNNQLGAFALTFEDTANVCDSYSLYSLDLSNNQGLYDIEFISSLSEGLRELNVSGCVDLCSFPDGIYFDSLTSLNIDDTVLESLSSMFTTSSAPLNFSMLSFSMNNVTTLTDWAFLNDFAGLSSFYARNTKLTDAGLFQLLNNTEMQAIDVSYNNISDPTPLYTFYNTLEYLDLSNNYICGLSEDGSEFLGNFSNDLLSACPTLLADQNECPCSNTDELDLSNDIVCRQLWDSEWGLTCSRYSYKQYESTYLTLDSSSSFQCSSFLSTPRASLPPCIDSSLLHEHIQCAYNVSEGMHTECIQGWYGDICDNECPVTDDDNEILCSDHGSCDEQDHVCDCSNGWDGALCDVALCPVNDGKICDGNGNCDEDSGICVCDLNPQSNDQWWYGTACQSICPTNPSTDVSCSGLGVCNPLSHSCLCAWGFSGDACQWNMCAIGYGQNRASSECFDHGSCVAGDPSKNE